MINKLSELVKQKTLIIIYNLKFNTKEEIDYFASNTISKFCNLT